MATAISPQDSWSHVSEIIRLIRTGQATTRPEIARATGLSRNTVTLRVQTAQDLGLIAPSGGLKSLGGRAAEVWQFRGESGHILVGMIDASQFYVALTDLNGNVLGRTDKTWRVDEGAEASVRKVADEMHPLLEQHGVTQPWGIGIGMAAPVDFGTGLSADPVAPSKISYRWPLDFDVRQWFSNEFSAPCWVDSVINLTTLGASRAPGAPADMIYVKIGTGLGLGLVSGGRLHRGATWVAGELNHVSMTDDPERICLCGRIGCLETYSSGWAILTDGQRAADSGKSPYLAAIAATRPLSLDDIGDGVLFGDSGCVEIVVRAADMLGRALSWLITLFNPARVAVGGFAISENGLLRSVLERTIRTRTLAASVADLEITQGVPDQQESLLGAVDLVTETLTSAEWLSEWGPVGSPVGVKKLLKRKTQTPGGHWR